MAEPKPAAYGAPAAQALVASTTDRVRPNAKLIALLSLGHFVVDLNQGSLPAVLPFLKSAHQLSYASAATIVLAANVASSLVQPLFGYCRSTTSMSSAPIRGWSVRCSSSSSVPARSAPSWPGRSPTAAGIVSS